MVCKIQRINSRRINIKSEMENTVILVDEDGNEMRFEVLEVIEYEGEDYAILVAEEGDDADTVVIVRVDTDENGEETFSSVEDEDLLDNDFEFFKENFSDEFDFVD